MGPDNPAQRDYLCYCHAGDPATHSDHLQEINMLDMLIYLATLIC